VSRRSVLHHKPSTERWFRSDIPASVMIFCKTTTTGDVNEYQQV
jgi:hypothetical protein